LMRERDQLRVVSDQRGNPTSAEALARACLDIATRFGADRALEGLYHLAGAGEASWHELALATADSLRRYQPVSCTIEAISTADYGAPAARPRDSRLDCGLISERMAVELPHWRKALDRCIDAWWQSNKG
jgi:dTDP-4-dehydrorhamnose reductase